METCNEVSLNGLGVLNEVFVQTIVGGLVLRRLWNFDFFNIGGLVLGRLLDFDFFSIDLWSVVDHLDTIERVPQDIFLVVLVAILDGSCLSLVSDSSELSS